MTVVAIVIGVVLIVVVLWEGFETIVLPRRVTRRFRLTRLFYRVTWIPWTRIGELSIPLKHQETWLSIFGPLSLLFLLSLWAFCLITGFALLFWALASSVLTQTNSGGFLVDLYMSATTFFTLGLGDAISRSTVARFLMAIESGMGFAFLALIISYLPALNQSFSHREITVSLLDARAGSPPTASEMLRRHSFDEGLVELKLLLQQWERWAAEFLEGHLSYPVLAYFRSQHDNQSWLAALTAILDTCALIMASAEGTCQRQARLTFAMARHALVDLSLVFRTQPERMQHDRLPPEKLIELREVVKAAKVEVNEVGTCEVKLAELRGLYEPYLASLARYFRVQIPSWTPEKEMVDNWQASSWEVTAPKDLTRRDHF